LNDNVHVPPRVIAVAVEPSNPSDQPRFEIALSTLLTRDPVLRTTKDAESGRTKLLGSSELHLDKTIDSLRREFRIELRIGAPQVVYRVTVTSAAIVDYTHKKQTGSSGQFARVKVAVEPNLAGMGNEFTNEIVNGSIPIEYIAGVQTGIESALQFGVLAGFPVVDVKVALVDGAYHDVDSSLLAFEIAACVALHEALLKSAPVLLEPIMEIEIVTPRDCMTVIIDDLRKRRGRITAQALAANTIVLKATVRLATLFGYANPTLPTGGLEGRFFAGTGR
jgi:elongation factor G